MIDHDSIYQALKMIERKNFMPEELEKNEKEIKGRTIWEEGMKKMIEEKLANENKKEVPAK